jgi:hypothetical protein
MNGSDKGQLDGKLCFYDVTRELVVTEIFDVVRCHKQKPTFWRMGVTPYTGGMKKR